MGNDEEKAVGSYHPVQYLLSLVHNLWLVIGLLCVSISSSVKWGHIVLTLMESLEDTTKRC